MVCLRGRGGQEGGRGAVQLRGQGGGVSGRGWDGGVDHIHVIVAAALARVKAALVGGRGTREGPRDEQEEE